MNTSLANNALAWLLTYAVHSTLLLGLAWIVSRKSSLSAATRDFVWKVALVGGIVTSAVQVQLGVQPKGSIALAPVDAAAPTNNQRAANGSANDGTSNDTNNDAVASNSNAAAPTVPAPGAKAIGAIAATVRNANANLPNDNDAPLELPPASTAASKLPMASYVVIGWAVLAVGLAGTYFARRLILVGRLASRQAVSDGPLPAMLDALCRKVGHRSTIALTSVNTISSPVALGLHEICLPEAALTDLEPDQQQSLLAHELAHLVRRDPIWLYSASLLEQLFFFQPLNRVARKELQQNAEYLCDDWAAARTGSGLPLAHCLARVADWMVASPLGVPVAGMAEQRSLLIARVARLIDGKRPVTRSSRVAFGIGAVALLATTVAAAPGVQTHGTHTEFLSYWSGTSGMKSALPGQLPVLIDNSAAKKAVDPSSGDQTDQSDKQVPEDPVVVAALIERLRDSDAGVRRAAASSLGKLKSKRAVTPLIEVLGDRNKDVRLAAIEALGNLEDASAVPALARLMTDDLYEVREHALEALGNFTEALTASQILPALKDGRPEIRARAAEILGEIGDRSAVSAVAKLLSDPSANVRHEVLHALEHLQDRSVAPSIRPLLKDENNLVRGAALSALRELKLDLDERDIVAALDDADADVRKMALEYVKDLHPVDAMVPALRKLLDDSDSDVRQEAVDALAEIRSPAARAAIRLALKSDDAKVRRRAAEVLGDRP